MKKITLVLLSFALLILTGCSKKSDNKKIAVFVPGICDDSPSYQMLVEGVTNAVEEYNSKISDNEKV